jgi:hypothetical protein
VFDSRVCSPRCVDLQPSRPTPTPLSALTATTTNTNEDTCGEDEYRNIELASGTPRIPRIPSCSHPSPSHIPKRPLYNSGCDLAMEHPSLPGIDNGPDANDKTALVDVVRSTHPHLCLGLMPFTGIIIGHAGIRYPGSWRGS